MEWFCHISPGIPAETLVEQCTLTALPALCAGVHAVPEIDAAGRRATIECVWGVFTATVEPIRHGVRYALTTCPNALQWTVTTRHGKTTLHLTINDTEPDPDFVESIREFMQSFHAA
jgi:hypothetical protein